jgi:serine/threonine protein kinase
MSTKIEGGDLSSKSICSVTSTLSTSRHLDTERPYEHDKSVHGTATVSLDASQSREKVELFFEDSTLKTVERDLPTFDKSELKLGKFLGRGGFSDVDEIKGIQAGFHRLRRTNSMALDNKESREFIAAHCTRPSGDARYAIKKHRRDVLKDPERCWEGIVDLVVETRFLINLEHPNIIKLRGIAACDPFSEDYFLVLDRLCNTLQTRLKAWSGQQQKSNNLVSRLKDLKGIKRAYFLEERLAAAFDLSSAIEYMVSLRFSFKCSRRTIRSGFLTRFVHIYYDPQHSSPHSIIHRDLKPDNIGFDVRGDIKIFDFGMARELLRLAEHSDGTYNFTQMTGTLRYMAPEVALGHPYNASVDAYSFSIILWEILALDRAYKSLTSEDEFKTAFRKGNRPRLQSSFSERCKAILAGGWSPKLQDRLTMSTINGMLRRELIRLRNGDDTGLELGRRRSTFVFVRKTRSIKAALGL